MDFVINAPAANISNVSRKLLKMITIYFRFYTLLYNSTVIRRVINDFPLVLLYLDSLSEYHD